jgi:hypothetical protein
MSPHDWWPLRWRGPLKESAFQLIAGTPLNCLVVDSLEAAAPFREHAHSRGIDITTLSGAGAISCAPLGKLPLNAAAPVLAIDESVWPRVRVTDSSNASETGPTGVPWVDSNGWAVQLARARAPLKSIWVLADPPKDTINLRPESYTLAVADAAAHGARWVVSMPAGFTADRNWKAVIDAVRFFEKHKHWRDYKPLARLGILSDFAGDSEFLSFELLNLTSRRHQPFRVLEKSNPGDLAGLSAIIYADQSQPAEELARRLATFTEAGGLLILQSKAAAAFKTGAEAATTQPNFRVHTLGKGRMAIAKEDWSDPFQLAADIHLLMSHRNDLLRLFNQDSAGSYYSVSPDGRTGLAQILRFAARPTGAAVTLGLTEKYSSAQYYNIRSPSPKPITPLASRTGVDIPLPEFSVYAAVELGKAR